MLGLLKPTSFLFLLVLLLSVVPLRSLFPSCCPLGDGGVSSLYVHVHISLSFPLFSQRFPLGGVGSALPPGSLAGGHTFAQATAQGDGKDPMGEDWMGGHGLVLWVRGVPLRLILSYLYA